VNLDEPKVMFVDDSPALQGVTVMTTRAEL
jgi:hypothetical protein